MADFVLSHVGAELAKVRAESAKWQERWLKENENMEKITNSQAAEIAALKAERDEWKKWAQLHGAKPGDTFATMLKSIEEDHWGAVEVVSKERDGARNERDLALGDYAKAKRELDKTCASADRWAAKWAAMNGLYHDAAKERDEAQAREAAARAEARREALGTAIAYIRDQWDDDMADELATFVGEKHPSDTGRAMRTVFVASASAEDACADVLAGMHSEHLVEPKFPLRAFAVQIMAEPPVTLAQPQAQPAATSERLSKLVAELTYAAELLGRCPDDAKESNGGTAVDALLRLSRDEHPVVREGAVYGMAGHMSDERVRARLSEMATWDTSEGVRNAASEAAQEPAAPELPNRPLKVGDSVDSLHELGMVLVKVTGTDPDGFEYRWRDENWHRRWSDEGETWRRVQPAASTCQKVACMECGKVDEQCGSWADGQNRCEKHKGHEGNHRNDRIWWDDANGVQPAATPPRAYTMGDALGLRRTCPTCGSMDLDDNDRCRKCAASTGGAK
jgi:hypothetical protein